MKKKNGRVEAMAADESNLELHTDEQYVADNGNVRPSFMQRTLESLKNENVPLRVIPIFIYGALACIAPYLALYLRQLGIDAFRIGILFTIRPVLGVLCTPLWGYIADRFRIWRFIFIMSIIGTMAFGTSVILIEPAHKEICTTAISKLASTLGILTENNYTVFNQSRYLNELKEHMVDDHIQEEKTWMYKDEDLQFLFFEMVLLIIFYEVFFAANLSFLDVAILCELKDKPTFYSKFRSFGSLGWIIGSLLSAVLLQQYRKNIVYCGIEFTSTDYRITFILMACFYVCSLPIACTQNFEHLKKDVEYHVKSFMVLLMSPAHISVYVIGTFVGVYNGFVWYFLNYHLENLGATQLLMGAALVIGASSEILWGIFFQVKALERIGHINVITIALLLYCLRFLMYAVLKNPIWILPIELIQGVSYFAVWNTMVSYTVQSFPPQFIATSISFLNATFQNLGLGIGTLLSGFLIDRFNSSVTCYIYCLSSFCVFIMFLFARRNFTDIQPEIESMNLISKEEEEKEKIRKSVEGTRLNVDTPPTTDLTSTQVQTPTSSPKTYNTIDK